jgi:hypothetical protein
VEAELAQRVEAEAVNESLGQSARKEGTRLGLRAQAERGVEDEVGDEPPNVGGETEGADRERSRR